MKVPSQNINLDINLNRVSTNSRTFYKKSVPAHQNQSENSLSVPREIPMTQGESFVFVDGQRLNLNARRGTYIDLIV